MRLFFLAAILAFVCSSRPAAAQGTTASPTTDASSVTTENVQKSIVPTPRPSEDTATHASRVACPMLGGQVLAASGQPLSGATLLLTGSREIYVTNSDGRFHFNETVYQGQVVTVVAVGYVAHTVTLTDCTQPRLVLELAPGVRIKRNGKRAGQVTRMGNKSTNMK